MRRPVTLLGRWPRPKRSSGHAAIGSALRWLFAHLKRILRLRPSAMLPRGQQNWSGLRFFLSSSGACRHHMVMADVGFCRLALRAAPLGTFPTEVHPSCPVENVDSGHSLPRERRGRSGVAALARTSLLVKAVCSDGLSIRSGRRAARAARR